MQDDEGQGGGLHRRSEEGNEDEGGGSCSPHHDSSRGEEKRDEVGFRRPGSDSGKQLARTSPLSLTSKNQKQRNAPRTPPRPREKATREGEGDEGR